MTKKNVDDYLTEGMYGVRRPKEHERMRFLGTLRERIVIALSIGQVMSDSGLKKLEEAMQQHPNTKLILNGHVSYRFLREEKKLANRYHIPYTTVTNEDAKTEIGAVLTYDYAINKEEIFIKEEPKDKREEKEKDKSFLSVIKRLFK